MQITSPKNATFHSQALALMCVMFCAVFCQASIDDVVRDAHVLIDQQRGAEALTLLQSQAMAHSGERNFDYAYALSLMSAGRYAEAELVFDRLLVNDLKFHGARLDLAQTYIALGNYDKATHQLNLLSQTSPPKQAVVAIRNMRAVIATRNRSLKLARFINFNTTVGYDSNVNSATVVENFLGFDLDEQSREVSSDYFELGANGGLLYRLKPNLQLSGRLSVRQRYNSQAAFVDSRVITGAVALARKINQDYQALDLSLYSLGVDGKKNNSGAFLSGLWTRALNEQWRIGITGELGRVRFEDDLSVKDIDRVAFGLIAAYRFDTRTPAALSMRTGYGHDEPVQSESRYARDYIYASARLDWSFSQALSANVSIYYQDNQYDEIFFEQRYDNVREDRLSRVMANVSWDFRRNWSLNHTLSYSQNDTFVDIFKYEKFDANVRLNYLFR